MDIDKMTLDEIRRFTKEKFTPEERYLHHFEGEAESAADGGWGDPHNYARSKEINTALRLNHTVADKYSGPDAYNENGEPVEYKSTTNSALKATYSGLSIQPTWEEQEEYIRTKKIGCYPEHYISRYDGGSLEEVYVVPGVRVGEILMPKIRKSFDSSARNKDPRCAASLNQREIKQHGQCVYQGGKRIL